MAGELRVVSVIFCDLVGFTSRSEELEPDIVRELLSGYFEDARAIIGRHGGTIEKFIGDAVMAVWGIPVALENDAERAVRASLELVDAVRAYGVAHHLDGLDARVGVVTGQAAAMDSVEEGIVVGDRVNTAARIQGLAEPGTVLVDATTRAATSAAISYRDAGEHLVKGKVDPVPVWQAERAIAGALGANRGGTLEAELVGRDQELRLLKDQFHASTERGNARLVSIVGPAGVGKSRLAWEFDKYSDGLATNVLWHRGQCLAYGDGVAYWALAQMVRQRFGIGEQDPPEVVRTKLHEGVERWIPRESDRSFIEPRLAPLLVAGTGELARDDLFAGWRMLFERLAEQDPVVLVIDDLQWADVGLLDFLESLLDWSASLPIFLLTMARPELADRRPGWGQRRNGTSIGLDPLDDTSMIRLLDDLIELPPAVTEQVVRQAEGVPLYGVEIVRSLIDQGLVDTTGSRAHLVGSVEHLEVPATLTALLVARLDGLPPDERALVRDLAVLGTSFPRAAIDAVAQPSDVALDDLLASLVRREVLTVLADPLSPERGQLQFAQTLMRTVVYDNLTKRERKHRHIAVAQHLQSVFPEEGAEIADVIADHLRLAHDADPDADDASTLRASAAEAYQRAAARAASVGAPATALAAYRQALELVDDPAVGADLRHRAGVEARIAGLHEDAITLLEQAVADLDALGRTGESRACISELSTALGHSGRIDESMAVLRAAVDAIEPDASDRGSVLLMSRMASVRILTGDPTDDGLNARVISYAESEGDHRLLVRALSMEGARQMYLDNPVYAGILHAGAVDLARQQGDPELLTHALGNYGQALSGGDIKAMDVLEEDFANARRLGHVTNSVVALSNLGRTLLRWGDWDDLIKTVEPEIDALRLRSVVGSSEPIHHLAVVAAWRGAHDEAQQRWELGAALLTDELQDHLAGQTYRALIALAADPTSVAVEEIEALLAEVVATYGWRSDNPPFLWPAGIDAAFARDDLAGAERLIEQLRALGRGHRPPYLSAELLRARARLALAHGDESEDVETLLRESLDGFEAIGMRVPIAAARFDLRDWLVARGRSEEAADVAAPAAETANDLGAVSLLDRL
ncbi:MAG: ATP-binding protein [Acidimicrobiales bacterium]